MFFFAVDRLVKSYGKHHRPRGLLRKLQFDSARFIFLLQLSGGGGGNTFRHSTK